MMTSRHRPTVCLIGIAWLVLAPALALAQAPAVPVLPPGEKEPVLRLEAGGPTSFVTGVAFSPDGGTLYAGGWDKVVRAWTLDPKTGRFALDPKATYRVPLGAGLSGAINALALSPDGLWLAVAGRGHVRDEAGLRQPGLVLPGVGGMSDSMREDQGQIYVFHTRTREVKLLRGHRGPILALTFSPATDKKFATLISAAQDWNAKAQARVGAVRVWNVEQATTLAELEFPEPERRPAILASHTGEEPKQLRVTLAWGTGATWIWDVATNATNKLTAGTYNNTLLAGAASSFFAGETGALKQWKPDAGLVPRIVLPSQGIPRAIAGFASKPGDPIDRAVLANSVVEKAGNATNINNGLVVVDLAGSKVLSARVPLWSGGATLPTLAASATHLAVAGSPTLEIQIYSLADLANPAATPRAQTLASIGEPFRYVSFVRQGNDVGLCVAKTAEPAPAGARSAPRAPRAGDLLFDATGRTVRTDVAGWSLWAPAPGVLKATHGNDAASKNDYIALRQGNAAEKRLVFPVRERLTDYALAPPVAGRNVPILAVALHDLGQPILRLYNAATLEPLREYHEHTERISRLEFSGDARLLATVAEDQTVRVWSLTDLDQTLGRRGRLAGLAIRENDGKLLVERVEAGTPAAKELQPGDAVVGLVRDARLEPIDQAHVFYGTISLETPGQNVTLRVARANQPPRDVAILVGQAIDERKPILSLFLTRPDAAGQREWVGWTPLGPYEASSRGAERLIGWHFNTGRPEMPTSFALADQYRDTYYRPGILRDVIAAGGFKPAPAAPPLGRPNLSFWLQEAGQPPEQLDERGQGRLTRPQTQLSFSLDALPVDKVESVRWQIVGDPVLRDFARSGPEEWSADLSAFVWKRGEHAVRVVLKTREETPQEFVHDLKLRFHGLPAKIAVAAPPAVVDAEQLTFKGQVTSDPQAGPVKIRLELAGKVIQEWEPGEAIAIDTNVKLAEGPNRLALISVNRDAVDGAGDLETTRQDWLVTFSPKPVPPPKIALKHAGMKSPTGSEPLLVSDGTDLRFECTVLSEEKLSEFERFWDDQPFAPVPKDGFAPGVAKEFAETITHAIAPGLHTLRVRAKSLGSVPAEAELRVLYQPILPGIEVASPASGTHLDAAQSPAKAAVACRLLSAPDKHPFQARLVVNGIASDAAVAIDPATQQLTADAPLVPGDNRIVVELFNAWDGSRRTEPIIVTYHRTPRITPPTAPVVDKALVCDLPIVIESPADLPLTKVSVNDYQLPETAFAKGGVKDGWQSWLVTARHIPLIPGENAFRIRASNADGPNVVPVEVKIAGPQLALPRPEIDLISPMRSTTVSAGRYEVRFRVRSNLPLLRVELSANDQPVLRAAQLDNLPKNRAGQFETELTQMVNLARGPNELKITAVSAGGGRVTPLILSYVNQPVRVMIDRLEPVAQPGESIAAQASQDHRLSFASPTPEGRAFLHGRVVWANEQDPRIDQPLGVRAWVNGFQQVAPETIPRAATNLERPFKIPLLLSRDRGNRVELELSGLEQEADDRSYFSVDCQRPESQQRLHLLVVGVDLPSAAGSASKPAAPAVEDLLAAMKADKSGPSQFKTAAFSSGRVYGPLTGHVSPGQVITQLMRIRTALRIRGAQEFANDVVMVYYQGSEAMDAGGQSYLLTSASQFDKKLDRSAISNTQLEGLLGKSPGAHLVLLDVDRSAGPTQLAQGPGWPSESRIGLIRSSWLAGKATPHEARLVAGLMESLSGSHNLLEIKSRMADRYVQLEKKYPNSLNSTLHVPTPLQELVLLGAE